METKEQEDRLLLSLKEMNSDLACNYLHFAILRQYKSRLRMGQLRNHYSDGEIILNPSPGTSFKKLFGICMAIRRIETLASRSLPILHSTARVCSINRGARAGMSTSVNGLPALQLSPLQGVEAAKRAAAYAAVDNHVSASSEIIGIGSGESHRLFDMNTNTMLTIEMMAGSTVVYVVERLVQQGKKANEKRWFIPTGFQSKELIVKNGLRLGDVDSFPEIDVTIDGADE